MAELIINGTSYEVADGVRLAQAIKDNGTNIGHRCGGNAKCTTCRVTFNAGEPAEMTQAEFDKMGDKLGEFRLACQIVTSGTMDVNVLMTKESAGWEDTGPDLDPAVQPSAEMHSMEDLQK